MNAHSDSDNAPRDGDRPAADPRLACLAHLCSGFGVESIYAFGSRGKDVADWLRGGLASLDGDERDVDIGVRTRQPLDVHDKVQLAIALEDYLSVTRVDLVCLPDADPFVAASIVRGERLHETDLYAGAEYELYVLRRAGDLIPLEEERAALVLGRGS